MKCKYCNDKIDILEKLINKGLCYACKEAEQNLEMRNYFKRTENWTRKVKRHERYVKWYKEKNKLKGNKKCY